MKNEWEEVLGILVKEREYSGSNDGVGAISARNSNVYYSASIKMKKKIKQELCKHR